MTSQHSSKKCILIDFYDSFTYNLVECFYKQDIESKVYAWDKVPENLNLDKDEFLVLGPGPGQPSEYSDRVFNLISKTQTPIIGICLGHQLIANYLGSKIVRTNPVHGQVCEIDIPNKGEFKNLRRKLGKTVYGQRYNSLVPESGDYLESNGQLLEFENFIGLQFHPESIGTKDSDTIFEWLIEWVYNRQALINKSISKN